MARVVWVGGGLLAASVGCAALTLGPVQGLVHIGHPLDVSVPLNLREGALLAEGCVSAQVFYADQAQPLAGVKTTLVTGAGPWAAVARVQTSQALHEPFARVEFLVGCGHGVSRTFALLADPAPPQGAVALPSSLAVGSALPDVPMTTPAMPVSQAAGLKPDPVRPNTPLPVFGGTAASPRLRLSAEMSGVAEIADAQLTQNRELVRLLWKALSDSPEQRAATALVTQARDAEIHRLKAALAATPLAPPDPGSPPPMAPPEAPTGGHDLAVFVGGLLTLAVAMGGLIAVLRRQLSKRTEQPPWWENPSGFTAEENPPSRSEPRAGFWARFKAKTAERSVAPLPDAIGYPLDIDFDAFPDRAVNALPLERGRVAPGNGTNPAHTDFTHSALFDNPRSVATEELFDMQQQVEFFVSLGQSDQAIEVLQTHLSNGGGDSPLIYLDLLKLYHEQGRRNDYALLQARFNSAFNGSAPDFDGYSTSRRGLERYGGTLKAIQALWPQPAVMDLIERAILRHTPGDRSEVFDLEAYRELLLLYGIAREVIDGPAADSLFSSVTGLPAGRKPPAGFWESSDPHAVATGAPADALDLDFFGFEVQESAFTPQKTESTG